ncbi:MAG TPA: poly granule associated family protein [Albitalea sp.]|nr:poly granule associated family protein [Albitalea sp.]
MAQKNDTAARKRAKSAIAPAASIAAAAPVPPAPAAPADADKPAAGAKGLLRAGLKALGEVRDDVVTRQSRIFEALLGIDTSALLPRGIEAIKKPGVADNKFEDLFDQRVARSLERLGMPSPEALTKLCRQLEAINEHLQRSDAAAPPAKKKAPAKRRSVRKTG